MKRNHQALLISIAFVSLWNIAVQANKVVEAKSLLPVRPGQQSNSILNAREHSSVGLSVRGGGCCDSDPVLFMKIGTSAAAETALLTSVLAASQALSSRFDIPGKLLGLSTLEAAGLFLVIFASSFFGSIADGGLSAATNQVLDPNSVAGDPNWYARLKKPVWNPPGWLFPIMWLIVSKPTQFIAVSKIIAASKSGSDENQKLIWKIITVYCSHLSLGDAWNKVFFGLQCTGRGAAVITVFFGMLLTSAYLFSTIDPSAGLFMLPTSCWVLVATALNWNIYLNNRASSVPKGRKNKQG